MNALKGLNLTPQFSLTHKPLLNPSLEWLGGELREWKWISRRC
jgi:hypothetical protein